MIFTFSFPVVTLTFRLLICSPSYLFNAVSTKLEVYQILVDTVLFMLLLIILELLPITI